MAREITLYTQAGCVDRARVRSWFTERGVAFVERNVSRDPAAMAELAGTGVFATPLLLVGDRRIVGFRPHVLVVVLGLDCG